MNLTPISNNMNVLTLNDVTEVLFSYKTPVALKAWKDGIGNTFMKTDKKWSSTTTRHIKQFFGSFLLDSNIKTMSQEYFDSLISEVK